MALYALLLHEAPETFHAYSPDEMQRIVEEYVAWADALRANDQCVGGYELRPEATLLRHRGDDIVVDGPFTETKEVIGGLFIIRAVGRAMAEAIARTCPHLTYGGWIELRDIVGD
jgi:hypothetical protein